MVLLVIMIVLLFCISIACIFALTAIIYNKNEKHINENNEQTKINT